jgi:hypothetical protein
MHLRNARPFGLAVLLTAVPLMDGCSDAVLPPFAEASAELVIPAHFRAPIDRESAIAPVKRDSVRRPRATGPLLYGDYVDYPTNLDGTPNTNVAASITGGMTGDFKESGSETYWEVVINSWYTGNRATHKGDYQITKGGSVLWPGTVSGTHGGYLGLFLPGEKQFSSSRNGYVPATCDLAMNGSGEHAAWYSAPAVAGLTAIEWGHASATSNVSNTWRTCAENPPPPVEPTPPPGGGGSSFCIGPLKWYLCWYIDYYDWYGSYLGRQWLYCEPLCD